VTYSLNYTNNHNQKALEECAKIIRSRFVGISSGTLIGLEKLKTIEPPGKVNITAANSYIETDGFSCLDGKLLQGNTCGKSTEGASKLLEWSHM